MKKRVKRDIIVKSLDREVLLEVHSYSNDPANRIQYEAVEIPISKNSEVTLEILVGKKEIWLDILEKISKRNINVYEKNLPKGNPCAYLLVNNNFQYCKQGKKCKYRSKYSIPYVTRSGVDSGREYECKRPRQ